MDAVVAQRVPVGGGVDRHHRLAEPAFGQRRNKEVEGEFRDCAKGLLPEGQMQKVFDKVWALEKQQNVTDVLADLDWRSKKKAA